MSSERTQATSPGADSEEAILGRPRGAVEDPVHRVSYSFRHEGSDLWVYSWLEDGAHLPEHFHPSLDEYWETLEGAARVRLDGAWRDLVPGDGPVHVAPNVRHELRNESGRLARMRTRVTPGGRLEEFLTESAQAAREGLISSRNLPTSLRAAGWIGRFALRFRDETVMTSPPPALQRVALPLLARLGRDR
ncbi:MAG TPA: cupin domain-containing protein [Solirubrobacterales bacterium]|nr:cupin domain-containing protein [Solirubrobacterales bacterium]